MRITKPDAVLVAESPEVVDFWSRPSMLMPSADCSCEGEVSGGRVLFCGPAWTPLSSTAKVWPAMVSPVTVVVPLAVGLVPSAVTLSRVVTLPTWMMPPSTLTSCTALTALPVATSLSVTSAADVEVRPPTTVT